MEWICWWVAVFLTSGVTGHINDNIVTLETNTPVQMVSERFISMTLDPKLLLHNRTLFWKYSGNLARGLSPAYLRLGSPDSNSFHFHLNGEIQTFGENDWVLINKLANDSGIDLIVCLNPLQRVDREWDSTEAEDLISFSDEMGFHLSWQLGFELQTLSDQTTGKQLGRELIRLREILDAIPRYAQSPIFGPDIIDFKSNKGGQFLDEFFKEAGNSLNAITWHPSSTESGEIENQYKEIINTFGKTIKNKPLWLGERGSPSNAEYLDALKAAHRLGTAAKLGVQVILQQAFIAPTSLYWISLLHKSLMGRAVLDTHFSFPNGTLTYVFAHCSKNLNESSFTPKSVEQSSGSITIFAINLSGSTSRIHLKIPSWAERSEDEIVYEYVITSGNFSKSRETFLNGKLLEVNKDGTLPELQPKIRLISPHEHSLMIPSKSVVFWVIPEVKARGCLVDLPKNIENQNINFNIGKQIKIEDKSGSLSNENDSHNQKEYFESEIPFFHLSKEKNKPHTETIRLKRYAPDLSSFLIHRVEPLGSIKILRKPDEVHSFPTKRSLIQRRDLNSNDAIKNFYLGNNIKSTDSQKTILYRSLDRKKYKQHPILLEFNEIVETEVFPLNDLSQDNLFQEKNLKKETVFMDNNNNLLFNNPINVKEKINLKFNENEKNKIYNEKVDKSTESVITIELEDSENCDKNELLEMPRFEPKKSRHFRENLQEIKNRIKREVEENEFNNDTQIKIEKETGPEMIMLELNHHNKNLEHELLNDTPNRENETNLEMEVKLNKPHSQILSENLNVLPKEDGHLFENNNHDQTKAINKVSRDISVDSPLENLLPEVHLKSPFEEVIEAKEEIKEILKNPLDDLQRLVPPKPHINFNINPPAIEIFKPLGPISLFDPKPLELDIRKTPLIEFSHPLIEIPKPPLIDLSHPLIEISKPKQAVIFSDKLSKIPSLKDLIKTDKSDRNPSININHIINTKGENFIESLNLPPPMLMPKTPSEFVVYSKTHFEDNKKELDKMKKESLDKLKFLKEKYEKQKEGWKSISLTTGGKFKREINNKGAYLLFVDENCMKEEEQQQIPEKNKRSVFSSKERLINNMKCPNTKIFHLTPAEKVYSKNSKRFIQNPGFRNSSPQGYYHENHLVENNYNNRKRDTPKSRHQRRKRNLELPIGNNKQLLSAKDIRKELDNLNEIFSEVEPDSVEITKIVKKYENVFQTNRLTNDEKDKGKNLKDIENENSLFTLYSEMVKSLISKIRSFIKYFPNSSEDV